VPPLDESAVGTLMSLRKQLESTAPTPCARRATPRWTRSASAWRITTPSASGAPMDGKFPVDSSGTLPNGKIVLHAREMRAMLLERACRVSRCLTKRCMTYALGRGCNRTTGAR
jgi:hypothetical protein